MAAILRHVSGVDTHASRFIHRSEFGIVDYLLLLPALVFSSFGIPILLLLVYFLTNVGLIFIAGSILTLLVTTTVKALVKRERPIAASIGRRRVSLRHLETNHAWPSGDSAQAATFCVLVFLLSAASAWLCAIPLVMFSRVYYGFHWIGDTLGGATIGTLIALTLFSYFPL